MSNDFGLSKVFEVGDEYMRRKLQGESVSIDQFVAENPEIESQLRDYVLALEVVEQFKPGSAVAFDSDLANSPPPTSFGTPDLLDYDIIRQIGRGGMGMVYEAVQKPLGRRVALKLLPPEFHQNETAIKRFEREAKSAASLHHTNIVPVFDVGTQGNWHYYAMQFIGGKSLDQLLREYRECTKPEEQTNLNRSVQGTATGPQKDTTQKENSQGRDVTLPTANLSTKVEGSVRRSPSKGSTAETKFNQKQHYNFLAQIGFQVAEAIQYAHDHRILHRDIKPSNLLLDEDGNVWVADFGLAKFEDDELTRTGDVVGTIRYMSPERFQGQCLPASDIYSLGVTLYELAALTPAFSADNQLSLVEQIANQSPTPLRSLDPKIPRDLETIIHKAIQKQPERRYQSAQAFANDLRCFLEQRPITARKVTTFEKIQIWAKRNRTVATLLLSLFFVLSLTTIGSIIVANKFYNMAEEQTRLAQDAKTSKLMADQSAREAKRASDRNETNLYFADMRLAEEATRDPSGFLTARDTLENWKNRTRELRGWEWYWLNNRTHRERLIIPGKELHHVVELQDGKTIVFGDSGALKFFDLEKQEVIRTLDTPFGNVSYFEFDKTESVIAMHSKFERPTRFALIDANTGKNMAERGIGKHDSFLHFSPNNQEVWFASEKNADTNEAVIYRYDWKRDHWETIETSFIEEALFDVRPDGRKLAVFSKLQLKIFDTTNWTLDQTVHFESVAPMEIRWNPKFDIVALTDYLDGVCIAHLRDDNIQKISLEGFDWTTINWTPCGTKLITGNRRNSTVIVDMETEKVVDRPDGNIESVLSLVVSSSSPRMYTVASRSLRVWDLKNDLPETQINLEFKLERINTLKGRARLKWHSTKGLIVEGNVASTIVPYSRPETFGLDFEQAESVPLGRLNFSETNERAAGYRKDGSVVVGNSLEEILSDAGKEFLLTPGPNKASPRLEWNSSGQQLLILHNQHYLWLPSREAVPFEFPNSDASFGHGEWAHSGNRFAATHTFGRLKLFDVTSRNEVLEFPKENGEVPRVDFALSFSPDDRQVCYGGNLGVLRFLDLESKQIMEIKGHTNQVWGIDWSPDGKRIATASEDKTVRVWDAYEKKTTLIFEFDSPVDSVSWSPDSTQLAVITSDRQLHVFDGTRRKFSEIKQINSDLRVNDEAK